MAQGSSEDTKTVKYWRWEKGLDREQWILLRVRGFAFPEMYVGNNRWVTGSPSAMDAITGMGADGYSCGEYAFQITDDEAAEMAAAARARWAQRPRRGTPRT